MAHGVSRACATGILGAERGLRMTPSLVGDCPWGGRGRGGSGEGEAPSSSNSSSE